MKIAITGASGFVGSELLSRAAEAGHSVVPIVRSRTGRRGEFVAGNLESCDVAALAEALGGVDAVIHLAARTHVMHDYGDAFAAYRSINVEATARLTQAVAMAGVKRVVYMSSIKVNGEETRPGVRYSGSDLPQPEDDYGRTKYEAEQLVAIEGDRTGFETTILRPPLIYGQGVAGNFGRLVSAVTRGIPLPFGLIDNRRSLISVRNLADATLRAAEAENVGGAVLTLCDGEDVSTRMLAQAIGRAVGRPARLVPVPSFALRLVGRAAGRGAEVRRLLGNLQVDTSVARRALGWMPTEQLEQALPRMLGDSDNAKGKS
jgi:nucleoside-diphosphate-sugar epimerase